MCGAAFPLTFLDGGGGRRGGGVIKKTANIHPNRTSSDKHEKTWNFSFFSKNKGIHCFQVNSVKVKGGWTAFQAFLATVGRLVSPTFVVCKWEERAEHRLVGLFR